MISATMRRVFIKALTLAVLGGCTFFFATPRIVVGEDIYCESCEGSYFAAVANCEAQLTACMMSYDQSYCEAQEIQCLVNAGQGRDGCASGCAWRPTSGGGGHMTKTPCQQACYAARVDCHQNGSPDIEDCLNSGETIIWCCHQPFLDCMAGCE